MPVEPQYREKLLERQAQVYSNNTRREFPKGSRSKYKPRIDTPKSERSK